MKKNIVNTNGFFTAVIKSDKPIITDAQSALDLAMSVIYEDNCGCIAIYKECLTEDFFKLSTKIAGEILQKFVNYNVKLAIIGDFTEYKSEALKDFIFECNRGNHIFFTGDEQSALEKLARLR